MQEAVSYRSYFNRNRTVLFLHPHPAEISELRDVFHSQGFMSNVAVSLREAGRLIADKEPDAIVADAERGQASAQVAILKDMSRGSRIYVIADEPPVLGDVVRAAQGGARDVFAPPLQLTEVVREVEADLAPDVREANGKVRVGGFTSLTKREREVLELILQGGSNKEAGKLLNISPRTVEVHRARVMTKLGARNTAEMVRIALGR